MIPNLSMYSTEALIQELDGRGDLGMHYDKLYSLWSLSMIAIFADAFDSEWAEKAKERLYDESEPVTIDIEEL